MSSGGVRAGLGTTRRAQFKQRVGGLHTTSAAELGLTIAADAWGDDQDQSGGIFDRPGWEKILRRIESGDLGGVIVMRVDRFARNVPDGAAQIRRIVNDCNAFFGSAQERMSATTPSGIYMLQQSLNNAEVQLNMVKGSWEVAKERAIGAAPTPARRPPLRPRPERCRRTRRPPLPLARVEADHRRAFPPSGHDHRRRQTDRELHERTVPPA